MLAEELDVPQVLTAGENGAVAVLECLSSKTVDPSHDQVRKLVSEDRAIEDEAPQRCQLRLQGLPVRPQGRSGSDQTGVLQVCGMRAAVELFQERPAVLRRDRLFEEGGVYLDAGSMLDLRDDGVELAQEAFPQEAAVEGFSDPAVEPGDQGQLTPSVGGRDGGQFGDPVVFDVAALLQKALEAGIDPGLRGAPRAMDEEHRVGNLDRQPPRLERLLPLRFWAAEKQQHQGDHRQHGGACNDHRRVPAAHVESPATSSALYSKSEGRR